MVTFPECPACHTTMEPGHTSLSKMVRFERTLECPACRQIVQTAGPFDTTDADVVKWLRSGLRMPT